MQAPRPMPRAAIFDLDGTLIDTEALCNETGVAALAHLGVDVPMAFFETLAGIHDAERARLITAHVGQEIDQPAFYAEWDRLTALRMAEGAPLKPDAVAVLSALQAAGTPLALATSSRRGPAHEKLRLAGLLPYFDAVVTVDDVSAAKPAPDPYLLAAARLDLPASACVAFEDSLPGVASAYAAGCLVVQVPDHGGRPSPLADIHADNLMAGARASGLLP